VATALAALLLALCACSPAAEPPRPSPAPPMTRGALVLEPPILAVGQVSEATLAVTTPPDHTLRLPEPPAELPGFWVLGVEPLPVERSDARWVHRVRVRLRARAVGPSAWPETRLAVETPDGSLQEIVVPEQPLEVVSVLAEAPDRVAPFGYSAPEPPPAAGASWISALAGAAAALVAVALVALARRRRSHVEPEAREPARAPAWDEARVALAAAAARAGDDPAGAADDAAHALRRYVGRRFAAQTVARTTPELAAGPPPFGARSSWPAFLALLVRLDAARFPPDADPSDVGATVQQALAFVDDTEPPEELR
jgi:hypothetical protein